MKKSIAVPIAQYPNTSVCSDPSAAVSKSTRGQNSMQKSIAVPIAQYPDTSGCSDPSAAVSKSTRGQNSMQKSIVVPIAQYPDTSGCSDPSAAVSKSINAEMKKQPKTVSVPVADVLPPVAAPVTKTNVDSRLMKKVIAVPAVSQTKEAITSDLQSVVVPIAGRMQSRSRGVGNSRQRVNFSTRSFEGRVQELPAAMEALGLDGPPRAMEQRGHLRLSENTLYSRALMDLGKYFSIDNGHAVALADWDPVESRVLLNAFLIVSAIPVSSQAGDSSSLLLCTCSGSVDQRERLLNMDKQVPVPIEILQRERNGYCLHRNVVHALGIQLQVGDDEDEDESERDAGVIEQLQLEPLPIWAVRDDTSRTYGVIRISAGGGSLRCLVCRKVRCGHTIYFNREKESFGISLPPPETGATAAAAVISTSPIIINDLSLKQYSYPIKRSLCPAAGGGSSACGEHGNLWSSNDPVAEGWITQSSTKIIDENGRPYNGGPAYYRRTVGVCACQLLVDGSETGLLNIDNKVYFEYTFLMRYMLQFVRSGIPLIAFYETIEEYNRLLGRATVSYDKLYVAWNAFLRLIQLNEVQDFSCPVCGKEPVTVILDGTALSCRKDLIPPSQLPDRSKQPILQGLTQVQRVFLDEPKARALLFQFATGETKDHKKRALTDEEMTQLLDRLRTEDVNLYEIVNDLSDNGSRQAPPAYKILLRELSKNTPVCGLVQAGDAETRRLLDEVARGIIDISSPVDSENSDILRKRVPGLLECLLPIRKACGELPVRVRRVVTQIISKGFNIFDQCADRTPQDYTNVECSEQRLAYFPNWPITRGVGRYDDRTRSSKDEADTCRKYRHGHKVLGPGIITVLCEHGICYGFAVMASYESPKMPFDIFVSRYVPKNVIYDNSCKLHLYCLRREPLLFQSTKFLVDRFHWFNHSACAIGYDLTRYKVDQRLASVNSQVNEQLNAALVKLRTSLSYMTYEKFCRSLTLFLALRNRFTRSQL